MLGVGVASGARRFALALVITALLAGCGGGDGSTQKVVIPAPSGFAQSIETGAKTGSLSNSEFDDYIQEAGIAKQTHLKSAYQATYDSRLNDDSILVVVADFASAEDANAFARLATRDGPFRASRGDTALAPKIGTLAGIPNSVTIDPTIAATEAGNPVKTYDHAIAAVKGKRAMFIDYLATSAGTVSGLDKLAQQQYAAL